jgi:carbon-monoxide dehydrogenase large subunit
MTEVGRSLTRVEDERLITGSGCYIGDVNREGQVWARIVRSPVAHGRLRAVDLASVRERPDVVAAFAAADLPELAACRIPLRVVPPGDPVFATASTEPLLAPTQPIMASDRVRYVGEPIAVVVATDPYAVEDAAEEIWADIEELDPLIETFAAAQSETLLHPDVTSSNVIGRIRFQGGADVDALFERADVVVRERLCSHRHAATPMETRGLLADVEDGRLTVWGTTKVKHYNRMVLSGMLGIPEEEIRFIENDVGGGFGARGEFYPEDALIPWLALRLQRPVKWIEDRGEALVAMNQSREQTFDVEMAATADGRLLAFRSMNWCNLGPYIRTNGPVPAWLSALTFAGPYRWEGYEATGHAVVTNKTPLGTMRGPGEVEATFARERMIDLVAGRLGLDPAELRLRNLLTADELPYSYEVGNGIAPFTYATGDYLQQFRAVLDQVGYDELRARQTEPRNGDELLGVGVVCTHNCGGALEKDTQGDYEFARVVAEPDGSFTGYVGIAAVGQGVRTVLGQVLADALAVPVERVRIVHNDTDSVPKGEGAYADRATIFGSGALLLAVEELTKDARRAAAAALEVPEDAVEFAADTLRATTDPQRTVPLAELGCSGQARYDKVETDYDFMAAVAVVAVDAPTGRVVVKRYVQAYDVGHAINPLLVEGQLCGAAAQGLGGVLLEECSYDDDGQPLSGSFMDYLLPTRAEVPDIESLLFEFPVDTNPLGVKGAGNAGIVPTHGAVANAVADALGAAGSRLVRLPLRAERVRELLRSEEVA